MDGSMDGSMDERTLVVGQTSNTETEPKGNKWMDKWMVAELADGKTNANIICIIKHFQYQHCAYAKHIFSFYIFFSHQFYFSLPHRFVPSSSQSNQIVIV